MMQNRLRDTTLPVCRVCVRVVFVRILGCSGVAVRVVFVRVLGCEGVGGGDRNLLSLINIRNIMNI